MEKFFAYIGKSLILLVVILFVAGVWSLPTMLAWNFLMPYLFHLKTIGLLQAFCVNILAGSIFKSNIIYGNK